MRPRPSDDPVMNTRATLTPPVMPSYRLTSPNALPAPRCFPSLCARHDAGVLRHPPSDRLALDERTHSAGSHVTHRWREMDSNVRFRAFLSLRSSSVFSIPRSAAVLALLSESWRRLVAFQSGPRRRSVRLPR